MSQRKKAKKKAAKTKRTNRKRPRAAAPAAAPKRAAKKRSGRRKASAAQHAAPARAKKKRSGRKKKKKNTGWTGKFHKYSKVSAHRRRTHNPGGAIVQAGLAAGAGILAYLVTLAATYYVTKDSAQAARNRKIVAGVVIGLAALVVAKKRPLIAAGLAAGGALAAFGDFATLKMMQYLPQKGATNTSAVYAQNMAALQQINAVYAQNMSGLNQIGEIPAAPWNNPGPFG